MPNETNPALQDNFLKMYATPLSILVAGVFIAAGVYFALSGGPPSASGSKTKTAPIALAEVKPTDHIRGERDAKLLMVEYSDTECPFCKSFDATARQVIEKYGPAGDVAWVYRHFPITSLHHKAPKEAEALECAAEAGGNEAFWAFSDQLYGRTNSNNSLDIGVYNLPKPAPTNPETGKPSYAEKAPRSARDAGVLSDIAAEINLDKAEFESCLSSGKYAAHVADDAEDGSTAGGTGTPYVIFISREKISKEMRGLLDSLIPSVGPNTFVISEDGKRISINGALPFSIVDQLIVLLLR